MAGRGRALLLLASVLVGGCRQEPQARAPSVDEALLARRLDALEDLARRARSGPIVPAGDVLVVVHADLLRSLLRAALPYERVIGDLRVRVTGADVRLEDGVALALLEGRASLAEAAEQDAWADVRLAGSLDVVELDPASGVLRGRLRLLAIEAREVGVLGVRAPVERLVEQMARERLAELDALAEPLEIPVRLQQQVELPAVGPEGGVSVAAVSLAMELGVSALTAIDGRLYVTIGAHIAPLEAGT